MGVKKQTRRPLQRSPELVGLSLMSWSEFSEYDGAEVSEAKHQGEGGGHVPARGLLFAGEVVGEEGKKV